MPKNSTHPSQGHPMTKEEWSKLDQNRQNELTQLSLKMLFDQFVREGWLLEVMNKGIEHAKSAGVNPNRVMGLIVQYNQYSDPNLALPQEHRDLAYGEELDFVPFYRDREEFLGGPGAPKFKRGNPYKPVMIGASKDPEEGHLWVVVAAYGGAALYALGPKKEVDPNEPKKIIDVQTGEPEIRPGSTQ